MRPVIVSDTGPLIALAKLGRLELLTALFSEIHIPQVVLTEATAKGEYTDAESIRAFTMAHAQVEATLENSLSRHLLSILDEGETQALILAKKLGCGVLIDEKRGRRVARKEGIPVVGVLGVLLQAKRDGHIESLKPLVLQLQGSGYRVSDSLVMAVLGLAGES